VPERRKSHQRHRHRCAHWVVVRGDGSVACDGRQWRVSAGDSVFIPQGAMHRATAGDGELELIEVQRGALLSEEDIERFADDFGRVVSSGVTL
jgi:mannose-6-phosphate isomerase